MKKKEQFIKIKNLSVSKILFNFINNELLKGLKIKKNHFFYMWVIEKDIKILK